MSATNNLQATYHPSMVASNQLKIMVLSTY